MSFLVECLLYECLSWFRAVWNEIRIPCFCYPVFATHITRTFHGLEAEATQSLPGLSGILFTEFHAATSAKTE